MLTEKRLLNLEEIDNQTALELPDRETPGALVIIKCLICVGEIQIEVEDVNVGANVCAQVGVINDILKISKGGDTLICSVKQH